MSYTPLDTPLEVYATEGNLMSHIREVGLL
jgi:hypothetical protein